MKFHCLTSIFFLDLKRCSKKPARSHLAILSDFQNRHGNTPCDTPTGQMGTAGSSKHKTLLIIPIVLRLILKPFDGAEGRDKKHFRFGK